MNKKKKGYVIPEEKGVKKREVKLVFKSYYSWR